jgi:hypothetical protein
MYNLISKKKVDTIFLDTTFLSKKCKVFPNRKETILKIIELIENTNKDVYMSLDMLGTEPIIVSISSYFSIKFQINKELISLKRIDELKLLDLNEYVSEENSRFKLISKDKLEMFKIQGEDILLIYPSTQIFNLKYEQSVGLKELSLHFNIENVNHFLYSIHSSYNEIVEFIENLNPNLMFSINKNFKNDEFEDLKKKFLKKKNKRKIF